ncbi:unnamed protein product [Paramecium sonneborni]|uniref:Uncharacterized protein n=1 Tax=Paramecium sonneborni TaxID=65129 RepID=A0A8S1KT58_9CILI|nr:unnamed protein product [Paramecium sonneborni]
MQENLKIEESKVNQVLKVQKLFPFQINGDTIVYQSKYVKNLYTIINEEDHHDKRKMFDKLSTLFRIFYGIIQLLIQTYQIINLSRLNSKTILVELTNGDYPQIHFTNLHERINLVTYNENFIEIKLLCQQAFKSFQQKQINDLKDKCPSEEKQQTIKGIHYATALLNQFLNQLETDLYFKNIKEFLLDNNINLLDEKLLQKKDWKKKSYNNMNEQSIRFDEQNTQVQEKEQDY